MSHTYRAILRGDHIQWLDKPPKSRQSVPVHITLIPREDERGTRGKAMAGALEALAREGGVKCVVDPVAWQKQVREDKPLLGRDS